jgi:hypothetical protein
MLLGPMWVALIRRLLRDKLPTIATEKSSQN